MKQQEGVTFVELLMVMGLVSLIFTISILSLAGLERESQLDALVSEVKASIARAQSQTINGNDAGVYFETHRFVYFYGTQFSQGDPKNQETLLPNEISFKEISLPSQTLTFAKITGYIKNFSPPENLILLELGTGKTRQITINKLGMMEVE